MKMFVFPVGSGYYERQNIVVMAETIEEAEQKALDHIAQRQGVDRDLPNYDFYFNPNSWTKARQAQHESWQEEGMAPYEVEGDVALIYGVDG